MLGLPVQCGACRWTGKLNGDEGGRLTLGIREVAAAAPAASPDHRQW